MRRPTVITTKFREKNLSLQYITLVVFIYSGPIELHPILDLINFFCQKKAKSCLALRFVFVVFSSSNRKTVLIEALEDVLAKPLKSEKFFV